MNHAAFMQLSEYILSAHHQSVHLYLLDEFVVCDIIKRSEKYWIRVIPLVDSGLEESTILLLLDMSIKVAVLQSGDQIIAEMKEIVSEDRPIAYLFKQPHKLIVNSPVYLTEEKDPQTSVEITLAKWIIVSDEDDVPVAVNQVVALVEPIDSVKKMYEEKVNGSDY